MTKSLEQVADLAGYALPSEDLREVHRFFEMYLSDIQVLREIVLPEHIEPVTQLHMELWD
jgi:hypothetical protein